MRTRAAFALLALLPLGLVAGSNAAQGDLDPTFGSHGIVTTSFGDYIAAATALDVDPTGRIVVGGWVELTPEDGFEFAAARYKSDGSLDHTFGSSGKAVAKVSESWENYANAMALQPDGKIVVGGASIFRRANPNHVPVPGPEKGDFALVRFNPGGTLDSSFGSNGIVNEPSGSFASPGRSYDFLGDLVLQPDGKIVAAGGSNGAFVLVRYNGDGSLDDTFGSGGIVTTRFGEEYAAALGLARQEDGKLVAVGSLYGPNPRVAVARYRADGALDPSFGSGGIVTSVVGGSSGASSVVIQRDGKIVVGGSASTSDLRGAFALVRYKKYGVLDRSFGHAGTAITAFSPPGVAGLVSLNSIALQADGKIVAVGVDVEPDSTGDQRAKLAIARYDPDGSPDGPFFRTMSLGPDGTAATDVAIQRDGKVVTVGGTGREDGNGGFVFALARFLAAPIFCVVPNVRGRLLAVAKTRIERAHCSAGKIARVPSRRRKGRVVSQRPRPGTRLDFEAKVALVISSGRR